MGGGRLPSLDELEYEKSALGALGIGEKRFEILGATTAGEAVHVLGRTDDNQLEQLPSNDVDDDEVAFRCVVELR